MADDKTRMDYDLMQNLYKGFDSADEGLKQVGDKLKTVAADTANTYFTGIVGPSFHQHVEELCTRLETFRQQLQKYLAELRKVEQDFRKADADGAADVKAAE